MAPERDYFQIKTFQGLLEDDDVSTKFLFYFYTRQTNETMTNLNTPRKAEEKGYIGHNRFKTFFLLRTLRLID